ncbi:hypothetical protein M513_11252 [Trichuris suis]|uniref:Peptidase S1 domain-containing protein n=1 Tax=Trichuris suis TaxID=68888 RepID=A0A085LSF3_9BILA|nr:hypothetical protein M513_11252 [Trichuris suis]
MYHICKLRIIQQKQLSNSLGLVKLIVPLQKGLALAIHRFLQALCGQPYFKPIRLSDSLSHNRISNGIEARKHSHPWQALVRIRFGNGTRRCGGSLIDWGGSNASDLVLTAAHCLMDTNVLLAPYEIMEEVQFYLKRLRQKGKYVGVPIVSPSQVFVSLGLHDTRALDENMQLAVVGLAAGRYHQYTNEQDVGLLKLERKVVYNKFIQGICLPYPKEDLPAGYPCYVTGWGFLDENKTAGRRLQQIEVDIFEKSKCNSRVNKKTMFCAGSKVKNIGTCSTPTLPQNKTDQEKSSRINSRWKADQQYARENKTAGRRLQQIEVDIFEKSKCNSRVNKKTMFCAGSKVKNIGTCSGDSGGPLTCQKGNRFILYGVVSFSMKGLCSTIDDPTVFAKVPALLKWMKKEIGRFAHHTASQSSQSWMPLTSRNENSL